MMFKQTKEIKKEIEFLKNNVPKLSDIVHVIADHQVEYEVNNGNNPIQGYAIYNDGKIAIQKAFMEKGAEMKEHRHDVIEILLILSGKIKYINGEEDGTIFSEGMIIHIKPNTKHTVTALENTWIIGITIPADSGYPNAG